MTQKDKIVGEVMIEMQEEELSLSGMVKRAVSKTAEAIFEDIKSMKGFKEMQKDGLGWYMSVNEWKEFEKKWCE